MWTTPPSVRLSSGRVLEAEGYRVGHAGPARLEGPGSLCRPGAARLGVLLSAGNIDSMVAHYTAAKRRRSDDAYTPGGKAGRRPDRATIVYCNQIRKLYPDAQIVIGGLKLPCDVSPIMITGQTK